jgi:hypothetical protein
MILWGAGVQNFGHTGTQKCHKKTDTARYDVIFLCEYFRVFFSLSEIQGVRHNRENAQHQIYSVGLWLQSVKCLPFLAGSFQL